MALDYNSLTKKPEDNKGEQKERQHLQKRISGEVKVREKNPLKKIAGVVFEEDLKNVKTYVLRDVVIPLIKDAIADSFIGALEMLLYGSSSGRRRRNAIGQDKDKPSYTAYNRYSDGTSTYRGHRRSSGTGEAYDYSEIIMADKGDAEAVLDDLRNAIVEYKVATVADLYDLVGKTGEFTDNKYGWTNLEDAYVRRVREGYLLELPKARPIA